MYGIAATINSGNYVYFEAQSQLISLPRPLELITIFNEELVNLHRGQGMDIYWRDTFTVPTEAEYLHMISNKTGGLFRLAIRLMMAVSNSDLDLVEFANVLGLLFQIQDDYKNLTSENVWFYLYALRVVSHGVLMLTQIRWRQPKVSAKI